MSKTFILFIGLISALTCKAQNIVFVKEYFTVKTDTSLIVAVPFKNKIFCLKSNSQILVLNDETNQIEDSYADNSKELQLVNLYLRNDTLIGISNKYAYYLNGNVWLPLKYKFTKPPIFEDDKFVVTSTCSGEWGGTIYFKYKKTNKVYESSATCVINVLKINDNYNVTATLSHLSGFSNVFEIGNPLLLNQTRNKKIRYVGDNESKSKTGTVQLVDTIGLNSISSFIYKDKIYYLIAQREGTFIATIKDHQFIMLNRLSDSRMWSYNPINRSYPNETIYSFSNDKISGFIRIKENRLKFYSFNRKDK